MNSLSTFENLFWFNFGFLKGLVISPNYWTVFPNHCSGEHSFLPENFNFVNILGLKNVLFFSQVLFVGASQTQQAINDGIQIWIIKFPFYSEINKFLPLSGFEPRTSPVASRCANHWALTTWSIRYINWQKRALQ